jgi:hypothetical protein
MGRRQRELLLQVGVPMRGDHVDLRLARLPSGHPLDRVSDLPRHGTARRHREA